MSPRSTVSTALALLVVTFPTTAVRAADTIVFPWSATLLGAAEGMTARIETIPLPAARRCRFLNSRYVVFEPDGVETNAELPLVVYLHGSGGRGDDIEVARRQAGRVVNLIDGHRKEAFFAVAPQCARGTREAMGIWQPADLEILLDHVLKTLPVDSRRVYLTGNSMGGYGTWAWAAAHPGRFAAIAPVAGGLGSGGPKDVTSDLNEWGKRLVGVPAWTFHGEDDRVVPADRSRRMVAAIREHGGKLAKVTIYPGVGHGSGQRAFADPKLYEWMFQQRRTALE